MELMNLLNAADVGIALFGQTYDVALNWLGVIVKWILGIGSIGVGVILFSLILKVIVLPFDVVQRKSMRKQNIKMKENQAKMEKLQKQYANNKDLYNQKVAEMYKESGMNMFSSCLPMILSLLIFIFAINAFNAYSQYSNIENYNTMVDAYNTQMYSYCAELSLDNVTENGDKLVIKEDGKYIYITVAKGEGYTGTDEERLAYLQNAEKSYFIDVNAAYANEEIKSFVDAAVKAKTDEHNAQEDAGEITAEQIKAWEQDGIKGYFISKAQDAVVTTYNEVVVHNTEFLWIKNIWVTDASYKHPIQEFSEFKTGMERESFYVSGEKLKLDEVRAYTNVYTEETYNTVTGKLNEAKNEANGYFVLIILSIGTILLQQFVSMRSQKEQQKYSTVDGQGASQQKMMMVIMTGMFAIFSFMYSAAFSIYMITSNIFSLVSTIVINKLVDLSEQKKEAAAEQEKYNKRFPNKVVVDKTDKQSEKKEKSNKKDKK